MNTHALTNAQSPYTVLHRFRNGSMSNVFELDGPEGPVILKVATTRHAKREWENLERLAGVKNIPEPIAYLGGDVEEQLGLRLQLLGGYTTGFMIECVHDAVHLRRDKQGKQFFSKLQKIVSEVYDKDLALPSDIINGENILVSQEEPWLIDWLFANPLSQERDKRKSCIDDCQYFLFELERRYGTDDEHIFDNPYQRIRIF